MNKNIIVLAMLFVVAGCGSQGWVKKDGSPAADGVVNTALKECEFEKKRQEARRYLAGSHTGPEDAQRRSKQMSEKIYQEAVDCMKDKGFVRQ